MSKPNCFKFSIDIGIHENWTHMFSWLMHFKKTGMPAGIVSDGRIMSLWRAGERQTTSVEERTDIPVGTLRVAVNGFENLWQQIGGRIAIEDQSRIQ